MQTAPFPLRRLLRRIKDGGKRRQPHRRRLTLPRLPTAAAIFCGARDGHGEGRWAKEAAERDQDVEAMDRRNTTNRVQEEKAAAVRLSRGDTSPPDHVLGASVDDRNINWEAEKGTHTKRSFAHKVTLADKLIMTKMVEAPALSHDVKRDAMSKIPQLEVSKQWGYAANKPYHDQGLGGIPHPPP
ncbi:hypothetical protein BHE74_00031857 [Ensete ventricosum]|nr:hypothetical protein GW17_00025531 [Ensete ventricosum]RWW61089.1 hypothetical protein BHE74_00031857 [Ensete ventricosum]RZR78660.1 hypothetical protein BHM03_00004078 [Ensete ventricosum]